MKKRMAVISAVLIGISYCSSGIVVMADEPEGGIINTDNLLERVPTEVFQKDVSNLFGTGETDFLKQTPDLFGIEEPEEPEKTTEYEAEKQADTVTEGIETSEMKDLQIPQRLQVVIDPWELDRKGQIYSETYMIKNQGETDGILTLSELTCKPCRDSGVSVLADKANMHSDEEKSVYMEITFGNGERIVLSEVGTEYKVKLKAGEELSFCFTGEVNEYAAEKWKNGDVLIGVIYSWDVEEEKDEIALTDMLATDEKEVVEEQEVKDPEREERLEEEEPEEEPNENIEDTEESALELPSMDEFLLNVPENGSRKIVDVEMFEKAKVVIDSWEMDGDEKVVSSEYVLRNAGEEAGTLVLSDFAWMSVKQDEAEIQTNGEGEQYTEDKPFYIELMLTNGEKMILSQDSSEYKVELKPDEEVSFKFVGEWNLPQDGNDRMVIATAICSWDVEDVISD